MTGAMRIMACECTDELDQRAHGGGMEAQSCFVFPVEDQSLVHCQRRMECWDILFGAGLQQACIH